MALVAYSDSEESDTEAPPAPEPKSSTTQPVAAAAFQKVEPRKIKVDLPTLKSEVEDAAVEPPAKRARTAGAFSGFNDLLPAPKKPAGAVALGRGVNLKTSSEAAFSRAPVSEDVRGDGEDGGIERGAETELAKKVAVEAKPVGKSTKFKPLSVQNGKKKKKPIPVSDKPATNTSTTVTTDGDAQTAADRTEQVVEAPAAPPPKPKRSLFSVPQPDEPTVSAEPTTSTYESMTTQPAPIPSEADQSTQQSFTNATPAPSKNLSTLASDLNLSTSERRRLFGRHAKHPDDINIAHFNMDAEYASNEQARQAGETIEHRAVKSIAPGKHSLQQLVNNARSQQEGLEDKWAEGRRKRGKGPA